MPTEPSNTPFSARQPAGQRRQRRSALFVMGRIMLGLLLLIAILLPVLWYLVPPYLVRMAQNWYAEQGEGYQLTIERWDLAFWSGRLEVSGLVFNHPGKQGDRSEIGQLVLDLDTGRVVKGGIAVSNLDVDGLYARIARVDTGWDAIGIHWPAAVDPAAPVGDEQPVLPLAEQLLAWPEIAVDSLHLTDVQLGWQQPRGSPDSLPRRAQIAIDDLVIGDFDSYSPDELTFSSNIRIQSLELEQPEPARLLRPLTLVASGKVEDWADDQDRRLLGDLEIKGLDLLWKKQAHVQLGSARLAGINATAHEQSLGLFLMEDLLAGERITSVPASAGAVASAGPTVAAIDPAAPVAAQPGTTVVPGQTPVAPLQGADIHVAPEASKLPVQAPVDSGSTKKAPLETTLLTVSRYQVQRIEFSKNHLKTALHELQGVEISSGLQDGYLIGATWLGPLMVDSAPVATPEATVTPPVEPAAANPDVAAEAGVDLATTAPAANPKADEKSRLPFELEIAGIRLNGLLLNWQQAGLEVGLSMGDNRIGEINSESVEPLELEGGMDIRKLNIGAPLAPTMVHLQQMMSLSWKGDIRDWRRVPELNGDLTVQGINLLVDDYIPVVVDQINLKGIRATSALQEVSSLVVSGASIREQPAAGSDNLVGNTLVSIEEYRVPSVYFDGQTFTTGVHQVAGAQIRMLRDKNGNIRFVPQRPNGQLVTSGKEPAATVYEGMYFRIAGFEQMEERDSIIFWHDQAIKPQVRTDVTIKSLQAGAMTNASLLASKRADAQPVEFSVETSLDEFNTNRFSGQMALVGGEIDGHLAINVSQLNLVPLSPYVIDSIGYRTKKGMLRINGDIDFDRGNMSGKTTLRLKNSEFEPADDRIIQNVSQQIAMPVETALSLLKDKNNNLKLELPISGSLSNPNVGLNDILSQLSQTAVKSATMFYLKQLLQPYTTMISVAQYAGEKLLAIRLDSLAFAAEKAELTDEHRQYLAKVAEMMGSRNNLELQVCPFVSDDEAKTLGSKWVGLADQRARLVKAELAGFKDQRGNSLSGRVTLCGAQKGGKPRVELGL